MSQRSEDGATRTICARVCRRTAHLTLTAAIALAPIAQMLSAQEREASPKPPPDLSTLDLEQLMQVEIIYAASKREQKLREAPSAVTVVTADEIRQHGFRTLADVLRSLPSFYVTYDRNYSYVGVRGFARPGDYSSRVLLLVNGLRTNDNIYDQAYVGEEFLVDVDLIDRVEVVRGPSAAIYGSSAFFAVINVVTKRGGDAPGSQIAASAASFDSYAGRVSYGRSGANGVDVMMSASYAEADGRARLYFPEFDDPSTNNGIVEKGDGEGYRKAFASLSKGPFSLQAGHVSREKRVPTGSYSTTFNDHRLVTTDGSTLTSVAYTRSSADRTSLDARIHFGQYRYEGAYPFDASLPANQDESRGEWWGLDLDAARPLLRRHLITVGLEYRDNYRQDQLNYDPEPFAVWVDQKSSSRRFGAFAQDEIKLSRTFTLHTGVRLDWYDTFGSATSPRVAAIFLPNEATTVKALYGQAFRAPNEYEFHYGGLDSYKTNPDLKPERIETLELIVERLLGRSVRVTAAGFRNRITDLIALTLDPDDSLLVFRNAEAIDSDGLEVGIEANRGHGLAGRISYALQQSHDRKTGAILTNSPRHMAKLQLRGDLANTGISGGLDTYLLSSRRTLAGSEAKGHTVTNLTLLAPRVGRLGVSATVYNVLDTRYGDPGSEEHTQDIIEQDGRTFRLKASIQF